MIGGEVVRSRFFYGWVVVAFGMVLTATNATIINSFGVFFKPLAASFGWSRAETSIAQSICLLCNGIFAVLAGWLADRFGRSKVLVMCGILTGSGLLLTSRINALWQIYLTLGVITGIGLSSTFAVTGIATARWFSERRGLALGIMTSGVGLGNFVGVPAAARLIEAFGWSRAYFILGAAALAIFAASAYFVGREPPTIVAHPGNLDAPSAEPRTEPIVQTRDGSVGSSVTLLTAVRTPTLWLIFGIFFLFTFCNQMVLVHLVNYATDTGITPLTAATLIGGIGLSTIVGRISMGGASDKIGSINALIIACLAGGSALVLLIYARELWIFYIFAIVYGFAQGSEVPQQPALIGKFFGFQTVLVGIIHCASSTGGALGSWVGGQVFDLTRSYNIAFLIAIAAISLALLGTLWLGRLPPK